MKVIDEGHTYELNDNKSATVTTVLTFFKDSEINGRGYNGTTNQEVLRALIDRIKFVDNQKHHRLNAEILDHLRRALVLHEMRHLERLADKNECVENIPVRSSGHFV